jgi:hypothetical protein
MQRAQVSKRPSWQKIIVTLSNYQIMVVRGNIVYAYLRCVRIDVASRAWGNPLLFLGVR